MPGTAGRVQTTLDRPPASVVSAAWLIVPALGVQVTRTPGVGRPAESATVTVSAPPSPEPGETALVVASGRGRRPAAREIERVHGILARKDRSGGQSRPNQAHAHDTHPVTVPMGWVVVDSPLTSFPSRTTRSSSSTTLRVPASVVFEIRPALASATSQIVLGSQAAGDRAAAVDAAGPRGIGVDYERRAPAAHGEGEHGNTPRSAHAGTPIGQVWTASGRERGKHTGGL